MMKIRTLKANFVINALSSFIPLIIAFITVPLYLHHIGEARYGILAITWGLLGYLGFLDLGLSHAAANALAKLRGAPQAQRAKIIVTTLLLNLSFGLIGAIFLWCFGNYALNYVLSTSDFLKQEVIQSFPWIVLMLPLALLFGVGIGTLESREKFLTANILQISGAALGQTIPVILAIWLGPSLVIIIPSAALIRAITVAVALTVIYRAEGPLRFTSFDPTQAKKLLSYGGWVTVTGIIGPLLASLDQFVIGYVLGLEAVTHYAVPMTLVLRSQVVPAALMRTLFPRMSMHNSEEAKTLAVRAAYSISFGYGAICAPAVIIVPVFFRYWIGESFAVVASPVAEALFFGAWINALAFVPYTLLQSQGRPDITGKLHGVELLPFIAILLGMVWLLGTMGAAVAWSLRCLVDAICLFWAAKLLNANLFRIFIPSLSLVASSFIAWELRGDVAQTFVLALLMGAVSVLLAAYMSEDLRNIAANGLSRVLPTAVYDRLLSRARKWNPG